MTLAPRRNVQQLLRQPETSEAVFIARELSKAYRMGDIDVQALRSVNLELYKGELIVLLGASGSGKSTLLNILGVGAAHAVEESQAKYKEMEMSRKLAASKLLFSA